MSGLVTKRHFYVNLFHIRRSEQLNKTHYFRNNFCDVITLSALLNGKGCVQNCQTHRFGDPANEHAVAHTNASVGPDLYGFLLLAFHDENRRGWNEGLKVEESNEASLPRKTPGYHGRS